MYNAEKRENIHTGKRTPEQKQRKNHDFHSSSFHTETED